MGKVNYFSMLELVAVEVSLPQYKHIGVEGENTLPHFGQIHPCCPNIPLNGLIAFRSCIMTFNFNIYQHNVDASQSL